MIDEKLNAEERIAEPAGFEREVKRMMNEWLSISLVPTRRILAGVVARLDARYDDNIIPKSLVELIHNEYKKKTGFCLDEVIQVCCYRIEKLIKNIMFDLNIYVKRFVASYSSLKKGGGSLDMVPEDKVARGELVDEYMEDLKRADVGRDIKWFIENGVSYRDYLLELIEYDIGQLLNYHFRDDYFYEQYNSYEKLLS